LPGIHKVQRDLEAVGVELLEDDLARRSFAHPVREHTREDGRSRREQYSVRLKCAPTHDQIHVAERLQRRIIPRSPYAGTHLLPCGKMMNAHRWRGWTPIQTYYSRFFRHGAAICIQGARLAGEAVGDCEAINTGLDRNYTDAYVDYTNESRAHQSTMRQQRITPMPVITHTVNYSLTHTTRIYRR